MESREIEALKIVWQKGGKASINAVARAMGVNSDYARLISLDIGKKDYIDVTRGEMCKITEKGKELLKSRGILDRLLKNKKRDEAAKREIKKEEEKGKPKTITLNY